MQYSTIIRKKDKGYQYIITYKENDNNTKWKTKSKQGYALNKAGKELARVEMDKMVSELKNISKNEVNTDMLGITFGDLSKKYLKHISLYRETNTILAFKTVFNHFICLDNIEVTKVSLVDIQEVMDNLTRKGLSAGTIQGYLRLLNTFFRSVRDDYNLIFSLPTKNIKIAKNIKTTDKRALTKKESDKILEDFSESKYFLLIVIALKCGLRLGEILGLTWDAIDTKNGIIKVSQQWKQVSEKEYNFGTLKSKNSHREVPIPNSLLIILKNNKSIVNIDKRLFRFKNTDSTSICLNRLFRIGGYNITIHELRHTYASNLIANGVDFKTAAQFLGHTVEQTMKTYSHVNDDMVKRATSIINNIL